MSDKLDDNEIPELRSLPREAQPVAALEERVVRELKAKGLMGPHAVATPSPLRWAAGIAACAVFFAAGWFARESRIPAKPGAPAVTAVTAGPRFLLLLRSGSMAESSPAVEAERVREYTAWGRELRAQGQFLSAAKLDDAAQLLTQTSVAVATLNSNSATGSHGTVQGFFLITASTLEEALRIARACPHLRHGGVIELRPIAAT